MQSSVPTEAIALLHAAAKEKGIAKGRDAAILHSLQRMAQDLIPGQNLFADIFSLRTPPAPLSPRAIGEAFWRLAATSREARRLEGSFYTPLPIIDAIIDLAWKQLSGLKASFCDPALGCGFFPLRLVERLAERGAGGKALRRWAAAHLFGCDRDPAAVFMSRALLWLSLSDAGGEFLPGPDTFALGDSLLGPDFSDGADKEGKADGAAWGALDWSGAFPAVAASGGFDVILGNPPYEVLTNFNRHPERRELADALRGSGYYRDAAQGQLNLYRCFIERSLALLRPGGLLSFVVPLSLARDKAASALRRRLLCQEKAAEWRLFSEKDDIFGGVTQSACIFLAKRAGGAVRKIKVVSSAGHSAMSLAELERYGDGSLAIPMLSAEEMRLWRWLRGNHAARLADYAKMRVGEVDQTFFRDCMRDDDTGCVLARGAHLRQFHLDVSPVPGKERFLDRALFLERKGASAAACVKLVEQCRIAQLGIRNMGSSPRLLAAIAPPGVFMGNSLNVYYPAEGVSLAFLAGLLNSRLLDWLFRLGSGNNNINLHEVANLPFPADAAPEQVRGVEEAYHACASLAEAGENADTAREELNRRVEACYGVPNDLLAVLAPDPYNSL